MEEKIYRVRTYTEGDWEKTLEMILGHNPELNYTSEYWNWRNRLSPHFDPSLVLVAEENGNVIGCGHSQVWDLKISQLLTVRGALATDVFVHREYRRRGIGSEIRRVMKKNLTERGAVIIIALPTPETYRPTKRGTFAIPMHLNCKTAYTKHLDCEPLKRKVLLANKALSEHHEIRSEFMKLNLNVLFRLKGFPPFVLELSQGKVTINEGEPIYTTNVAVTASKGISSSTRLLTIAKMFFSGDIKVRGLLRNFLSLYRCFKIFKKVTPILEAR